MADFALLLGNGINNISNDKSWERLLLNIINFMGINDKITSIRSKPFPLLYEEIFLRSLTGVSYPEKKLKEYIAQQVSQIEYNAIHTRIMNSSCRDILTTNYDYSLQKSIGCHERGLKNMGYVLEKTYSIFRHNKAGPIRIWHIHGECNAPQSITLGYEHYGGYLQQIRNYAASGSYYETIGKKILPLIRRLDYDELYIRSWIDIFFTKNIHIVGLSLDTSEIDLWWLLTFRARTTFRKPGKVANKVYYYCPSEYVQASAEKLQLLEANGVEVVTVKGKHDSNYYNKVIDIIEGK
ncbi:MAG: SIR2 family protein [Cytophagaceae bacterium]|nr:SIR2 family protein [Cytophagaceae bacterium]MDW8456491.1 SIR2 family protein [Cytophagaceae bacterium]